MQGSCAQECLYDQLDVTEFYKGYVPSVLEAFLASEDIEAREAQLPGYIPYLGGSRYSLSRRTAAFRRVTLETTRDDLLLSVIRGNLAYLGDHLREVAQLVTLGRKAGISGGGARIRGMIEARRRWTGDFEYIFQDQSSMLGAAMLGQIYLTGRLPGSVPTLAGSTVGSQADPGRPANRIT